VIFCCADSDAARLATALVTTLYHRVLIDIGTGVFMEPSTANTGEHGDDGETARTTGSARSSSLPLRRTMGADVRIIVPGDGCLLCLGNLRDYVRAVEDLCNHWSLPESDEGWTRQRAGSSRSLNQMAAGLGLRMLEDLTAERLRESTWAHLEIADTSRLSVTYPQHGQTQDQCPLCARAGCGDDAFTFVTNSTLDV